MKVKKGDLVSLHKIHKNSLRHGPAWRRLTVLEREAWYQSNTAKGVTCDGETKLPPTDVWLDIVPNRVYLVVRARIRAPCGYGYRSGCFELVDTLTGIQFFIERTFLENVT